MTISRREFLKRGAIAVPVVALGPQVFLRSAIAGPGVAAKNLILVELRGGNDGLNTLVPFGVNGGAYYDEFRNDLAVSESSLLKIAGEPLGFNPQCAGLKSLYDQGRMAVIQGVSYPTPSFSHEFSQKIWHTGDVTGLEGVGWLARWMNRHPAAATPSAIEFGSFNSSLALGSDEFIPALNSINEFKFPIDEWYPSDGDNRKQAIETISQSLMGVPGNLGEMARTEAGILSLIEAVEASPKIEHVSYPGGSFAKKLKQIVQLLASPMGMKIFHIGMGGFDTHDDQDAGNHHGELLNKVSGGLSALYLDLVAQGLDDQTLIVVYSEFGRTVYENGSGGTDHGTVNPVFVIGNGVNSGVVNAHPSLDPGNLTEENELPMSVDFRDVFGTVLLKWMGESASDVAAVFPTHSVSDLGFVS